MFIVLKDDVINAQLKVEPHDNQLTNHRQTEVEATWFIIMCMIQIKNNSSIKHDYIQTTGLVKTPINNHAFP